MEFDDILKTVSEYYGVGVKDICGSRRLKEITRARQVVSYLARKEIKKSYPYIGRMLGSRDHTTALHSFKKIDKDIQGDQDLKGDIDIVTQMLKGLVEVSPRLGKGEQGILKKVNKVVKEKKPRISLTPSGLERYSNVLNEYREGFTLSEIGKEYHLTRQRIDQIVRGGLMLEAFQKWGKDTDIYFKEFLSNEKSRHSVEKLKKHPVPLKIVAPQKDKNRWSKNYDYCRKCATTTIKHKIHGYCVECYPKTEEFKRMQRESHLRNIKNVRKRQKEYYEGYRKRPEVVARNRMIADLELYGGNREKAIEASNNCCSVCGISRVEHQLKFGRDLTVLHLGNKKNNELSNLKVVCNACFHSKAWQNKTIALFLPQKKLQKAEIKIEKLKIEPTIKKPVSFVLDTVADYYGITTNELTGKSRKREFIIPRMVAAFLLRDQMKISFPKIAQSLGNQDHTTAIHSYKKMSQKYLQDQRTKERIDEIIKGLM